MRYFFFILLFFFNSARAEEVFKEQNNDVLQFLPHTIKAIKDYEAHVRSTDKAKDRMNRMNNKLKEIKGYEKVAEFGGALAPPVLLQREHENIERKK